MGVRYVDCTVCGGQGWWWEPKKGVQKKVTCGTCNGKGKIRKGRS